MLFSFLSLTSLVSGAYFECVMSLYVAMYCTMPMCAALFIHIFIFVSSSLLTVLLSIAYYY